MILSLHLLPLTPSPSLPLSLSLSPSHNPPPLPPSHYLSPSLLLVDKHIHSKSHTNTHTHTHTHKYTHFFSLTLCVFFLSHSLSREHTEANFYSLLNFTYIHPSLSLSHTHTHTHTNAHFPSLAHANRQTRSLSLSRTHKTLSLFLSLSLSHTHTHTHNLLPNVVWFCFQLFASSAPTNDQNRWKTLSKPKFILKSRLHERSRKTYCCCWQYQHFETDREKPI